MKYLLYFFVAVALFVFFAKSSAGIWVLRIIVTIGFIGFVLVIMGINKDHDESDREKYQDKDKPYFLQKISDSNPFQDHGPSSRWSVWLSFLAVPIIIGIILIFTK